MMVCCSYNSPANLEISLRERILYNIEFEGQHRFVTKKRLRFYIKKRRWETVLTLTSLYKSFLNEGLLLYSLPHFCRNFTQQNKNSSFLPPTHLENVNLRPVIITDYCVHRYPAPVIDDVQRGKDY
jgi:hypothetical protein